jgi:hypothetical protein
MSMSKSRASIICDGCGAEFTWRPFTKLSLNFCCEDCADGLPCDCATRQVPDEEVRTTISEPASSDDLI